MSVRQPGRAAVGALAQRASGGSIVLAILAGCASHATPAYPPPTDTVASLNVPYEGPSPGPTWTRQRPSDAIATAGALAVRSATPTEAPWPTATETPVWFGADVPEAATVYTTLREAEAEIRTWLDPARLPRIEVRRYVRRSDLVRWRGGPGTAVFGDRLGASNLPSEELTDPVIVIVASTQGIDPLSEHMTPGMLTGQQEGCPEATSPDRLAVLALFDPYTGSLLADEISQPGAYDGLKALRPARVRLVRRPSPSATTSPAGEPGMHETTTSAPATASAAALLPTATSVPAKARLTLANMPPELAPVFRTYPLAPGSWWTWRVTDTYDDLQYGRAIVTQTVEAAWLEGDVAVVQSRIDRRTLWPRSGSASADSQQQSASQLLQFLSPAGIANSRWALAQRTPTLVPKWAGEAARGRASPTPRPALLAIAFDAYTPPVNVVSDEYVPPSGHWPDDIAEPGEVGGPFDVSTAAGRFTGCVAVSGVYSAAGGPVNWFCPGVGLVTYGFDMCWTHASYDAVANLIRWHKAELPER
jgi:hypothetical protein